MMSCHLIAMCHKWNMNADDIMMMWFALCVILVMSCLASMNRLLLKLSKYLSSFSEGYAAISLLIPFVQFAATKLTKGSDNHGGLLK